MKDARRLNEMLSAFLESDAGKLLVVKLGEQKRFIRLACGESIMSMTPVYFLDGNGLETSTESSAMAAAFTGTKIKVSKRRSCTVDDVVNAIREEGGHCCPEGFMYWLEKCTVEKDGSPFPEDLITTK